MPKIDSLATVALDAYFDPSTGKTKGLDAHRLALPRKVAIAINLCNLLGELHTRQVYCIDFKPENILANINGCQVTLSIAIAMPSFQTMETTTLQHISPGTMSHRKY